MDLTRQPAHQRPPVRITYSRHHVSKGTPGVVPDSADSQLGGREKGAAILGTIIEERAGNLP